jgi:hypothetical protein
MKTMLDWVSVQDHPYQPAFDLHSRYLAAIEHERAATHAEICGKPAIQRAEWLLRSPI